MFAKEYKKIGEVPKKTSSEIERSRIGIGFEKLDRALYDPSRCYDGLREVGAKRVRIQSGWQRTEKTPGVYDFAWLDDIVDNLLARDLSPWMCLCYGNDLYSPAADGKSGSVGVPPIATEKERAAWDAYVRATVAHFKGRVDLYEIWNEPDGSHCWRPTPHPEEYAAFCCRTADAIKETDPTAKIAGVCFCIDFSYYYHTLTDEVAKKLDYVTYHRYKFNPDRGLEEFVRAADLVAKAKNPAIRLIQGECGTQSRPGKQGALAGADWTEEKQAKFLLRKLVADLGTPVEFTSYFSFVDIFENIITNEVDMNERMYGFFGLLAEEFDADGHPLGVYRKKPSFRAMQTLTSLMPEATPVDLPVLYTPAPSPLLGGKDDADPQGDGLFHTFTFDLGGKTAFIAWRGCDLLTETFSSTLTVRLFGVPSHVTLVDPMDGAIYEMPEGTVEGNGGEVILRHVPVRDYPLIYLFD